MSSFVFNHGKASFANGAVDWDTNTMKCMLICNLAISCGTTNSSTTVTSSAAFGSVTAGLTITGTNIPANTVVSSVTNTSNIVISNAATGTATNTLTFSPNKDQDFVSNISGLEISGTGYTSGFSGSGRKTLTTCVVTEDDTNDLAKLSADNVTYSAITAGNSQGATANTPTAAVIYKNGSSDADSILCFYVDSGGFPVTTNGGDLQLVWSASGIATIT